MNMCLIQVIYLAGFAMSAACIQYWNFDAHQVLLTLFCVVFGVMSVSSIVQYIPDSASGHHAAVEVFRLIDQVSKIDATKPTGRIESIGDGNIEFKDVYFWYPHRPEVRVLKKLNFTIEKGQAVALVGFSGSGKSTVIQLLQRFYDPQAGSIQVGGQNLRDLNVAWWRKQVGMVGQEPVLFDVTLEESLGQDGLVKRNVRYGHLEATDEQVEDAARAANMDFVFAGNVKWTDRVGLRGEKLSGGQKQRVAIARALLRGPQYMLLDEATSALDSTSERLVQLAMQEARVGKTTITVAHRLSTIQNSDLLPALEGITLADIEALDVMEDYDLMSDLMWADPRDIQGVSTGERGGNTIVFGEDVTQRFLERNSLSFMIRSHEVKEQGYEWQHGQRCLTVFSAPCYCDFGDNKGAVVRLHAQESGRMEPEILPFRSAEKPENYVRCMAFTQPGLTEQLWSTALQQAGVTREAGLPFDRLGTFAAGPLLAECDRLQELSLPELQEEWRKSCTCNEPQGTDIAVKKAELIKRLKQLAIWKPSFRQCEEYGLIWGSEWEPDLDRSVFE
eukprot:s281_g7.t5